MSERQTPVTPDDTIDDDDDTVQGVSRRAERDIANAERLQREQNDAAGLTTETPTTPPGETTTTTSTETRQVPRKPAGA